MAPDCSLVVQAHQRDDVAHVVLVLDPAGGWPLLVREDAVVDHAAGRDELGRAVAMGTSA